MTHYITCVIGTRPEALKMIPVIVALQAQTSFLVKTIVTGQHQKLLTPILKDFSVKIAVNFNVMQANHSLNTLSANLLYHFEQYLDDNPCDLLIAQGDTTTTLIAALSAFYKKIPFAHVEAGLRTPSIQYPFPEEFNRRTISTIATLHFCPTEQAANNLLTAGIKEHIYTTGNTIIDTLHQYAAQVTVSPAPEKKLILVTCHRRENFGQPLRYICEALQLLANRNPAIQILFLIHPNPNIKPVVEKHLSQLQNITLSPPLDYQQLVTIMKQAYLILTDSGGLQEEGCALHKPVLILRNETERQEGIHCGIAKLVGHEPNNIIKQVEKLLSNKECYLAMTQGNAQLYGDGLAAQRITHHLTQFLANQQDTLPNQ